MLRRTQAVYLLTIVASTIATLFLPLTVLQQGDALFSFDVSGLGTVTGESELLYPAWDLFALTVIIAIIALVTVFLHKERVLQIHLCVLDILLILDFYGSSVSLIYSLKGDMGGASVSVKVVLSFPLVNLILGYLTIRNIGVDEALVCSLDRLH